MNTYSIISQTLPINWQNVPCASISNHLWLDKTSIRAQAQVCSTEDAMYVRLTAWEENIRAEETGLLGSPCNDSCLEFFFSPVPGDDRYFNIECNPNGCVYLGFGSNRYNLVRLIPVDMPICPEVTRFDSGWSVQYNVPYSFIRQFFPEFKADIGSKIRGNFYKCGDETVQSHYISWNDIALEKPDFHRPDFFGELVFA